MGVVYMLECDCGLKYVGRTSRPLSVCTAEHVNIKRGLRTHNVPKHFRNLHNRDPKCLRFWGLERVNKHWRGGNFIRHLSQRESFWIHETQVLVPGRVKRWIRLELFYIVKSSGCLSILYVPGYMWRDGRSFYNKIWCCYKLRWSFAFAENIYYFLFC